MSNIEKTYPYVMRWRQLLLLIALGAAYGVYATHMALDHKAASVIDGLIKLGPEGATIFNWCMAGFAYALVLLGIIGVVVKLKGQSRIAITEDGIILPNRPWKKGEAFVAYSAIRELSVRNIRGARYLTIKTSGLSYLIASIRLPTPQDFDEIVNRCQSHIS